MACRIGISLGDVTGIGPEVTLKALAVEAKSDDTHYLLIGDGEHLERLNERLALNLPLYPSSDKNRGERFCISSPRVELLPSTLEQGSPLRPY